MRRTPTPSRPPEDATSQPQQPYEAPAVAWEEDWDVRANLAVACAKRPGDGGGCELNELS